MKRALVTIGTLLALAAPAQADLSLLPGPTGCVAEGPRPPEGCGSGNALLGARALALAPDARHLYVAAEAGFAVTTLNRLADGGLGFGSCVSDDGTRGVFGTDGACADGDALRGPVGVAVSPDGRHVAVTARTGDALTVLARDPLTGALAPVSCVARHAVGRCAPAVALDVPRALAFSPDGRHLYVAASDGVVAFAFQDGRPRPIGCVTQNGSDGVCSDGDALRGASAVAVSPDGRHVYVTARTSGSITAWARDAESGGLTPAGCLMAAAPAGHCAAVATLAGANDLALNADGSRVYVTAGSADALTSFTRDAATGALLRSGCIAAREQEREGCASAALLDGATAIAVAEPGRLLVAVRDARVVVEITEDAAGRLSQASCLATFAREGCAAAELLGSPADVVPGPHGRVYVAGSAHDRVLALTAAPYPLGPARAAGARAVTVPVACPASRRTACGGRLVVSRGRRAVGAARFRIAAGARRPVRVALRGRPARRVHVSIRDGRTRGAARRLEVKHR